MYLSLLLLNINRSAKVSRKPPHAPQRTRTNLIITSSQLPQAFSAIKREEKRLEKKLIALEAEEEEKLNSFTTRRQQRESFKQQQQQQQREVHSRSTHRTRPKHGDNKWKRNLALARYPTPPEIRLVSHTHHETRRSSCDFNFSGSSDSSQEDSSSSSADNTMPSLLHVQSPSPHPHFTSSSTNCSPIYRRRTIPTITVTDMDRRRLSPLMLGNQDYMERVQVLSHSMPTLFQNDKCKKSKSLERGNETNRHPALEMEMDRPRSRPGSGRSSVVKLPPISPHPLTASCNNNSAKGKELTSLRTTLLM